MKKAEYIKLNGFDYLVNLMPGDRRSVSFRMISSLEIEVRYPKRMNSKKAIELVVSKSRWIEKKHALLERAEESGSGKGIYEGRLLYVFGKMYSVKLTGKIIEIKDDNLLVPVGSTVEDIEKWYGLMTKEAVDNFMTANKKFIPPCFVKIKKQKSIWGSCNSKRRIYINRRISMCPVQVIEYVMWHEISHLKHMNHSAKFYKELTRNCPDYKIHRNWLKEHSLKLNI